MNISATETTFKIERITAKKNAWETTDKNLLAGIAFQGFLIRHFEETLLKLWSDGAVHGPVHTSIGQEACAAGAMAALQTNDKIASTHRAHHHYLAKLTNYHAKHGFNVLDGNVPDALQGGIVTLMAEIMGLSIGCCGGRGGSMHLRNAEIGVIGTDAIVAGGIPLATGAAFACRYKGSDNVVVCFLGDGAVNQGSFHEALNLAGIWKLPIIYFIENNQYAVATSAEKSTAPENLAIKAAGYGIRGVVVDGMDPLAVREAVLHAAGYARKGDGATLLEAKCYRFLHHAGPNPGSSFGYRQKEEEKKWREIDPLITYPRELVAKKVISSSQVEMIHKLAQESVKKARQHCTNEVEDKFVTKEELWPRRESIEIGVRSDGDEFKNITFNEIEDFCELETRTYVEAIAAVTGLHLEKNEDVFVLGEEVASFGGGAYSATKGLPKKYPKRVLNTPISECGFTGLAGGAAMSGLNPVVEIMFPDFALVAADQLFNQIGKLRHMYGNTTDMPLVARTRIAIGCGYGGQHSMDPVGIFSLFSGWRIVAPSNAFDYIGLFNSAMLSRDPVLIVEHHSLYPVKFQAPKNNLDYFIPIGKAKIVRPGTDVTVLCYCSTVELVSMAARELESDGVSAEVIDLRSLSPADIDYETIGSSLQKTSALLIVEQAPASMAVGDRIAGQCQRRFFDFLDEPITTVTSLDIPLPVSKRLESIAVPSLQNVKDNIRRIAKRQ